MTTFSTIDIGRTGVGFSSYWLDTLAHNMANANTVRAGDEEPFRARMVVARTLGDQIAPRGSGVAVGDLVEDGTEAARRYEPDHPLADGDGYVTMPVVDLVAQMSDLILAQRHYQSNLRTIDAGRTAYEAALRLGRG